MRSADKKKRNVDRSTGAGRQAGVNYSQRRGRRWPSGVAQPQSGGGRRVPWWGGVASQTATLHKADILMRKSAKRVN